MKKKYKKLLIYLIVGSVILVIRYILSLRKYNLDILNHAVWTEKALADGLKGYYKRIYSPYAEANYPPFANLLFYLSHKTYRMLGYSGGLNNLLAAFYKIPLIIADLIIVFLLFNIFKNKKKKFKKYFYPFFFLINIALVYNSVYWGQLESVITLFCMLSLYFLFKEPNLLAYVFFALAVLTKQTALVLTPLFFLLSLKKLNIKKTIVGMGIIYLIIFIFFIPFTGKIDFFYPVRFYLQTSGGQLHQNQATVNAFNFWFLLGQNKISDSTTLWKLIDYRLVSILICLLFFLPILIKVYNKKPKIISVFKAAGLLFYIVFLFLTRMHERHLYPALAFLIPGLNSIISLLLYVIISFIHFFNMDFVWQEMMADPIPSTIFKGKIMAGILLAMFVYFYTNFLIRKEK